MSNIPKFAAWPKPDPQTVSLDKMRGMLRKDLDAVRETIIGLAETAEVAAIAIAGPRKESVFDRYSGRGVESVSCRLI